MGRNRKNALRHAGHYDRVDGTECVYCGAYAGTQDHVLPVAAAAVMAALGRSFGPKWLVPCCAECNSLAGAKLFRSLADKRAYIHGRIRVRYRKFLSIPDWDADELAELPRESRNYIQRGIDTRDWVRRRLEWRTHDPH